MNKLQGSKNKMLRRKGKRFDGEEEFRKKGIYFKMEKI